jgi:hypothetical protein
MPPSDDMQTGAARHHSRCVTCGADLDVYACDQGQDDERDAPESAERDW